jgi:unsaturated rhamnogalacturonyl hydrolase
MVSVSTVRADRVGLTLAAALLGACATHAQTARSDDPPAWSVRTAESVMRRHPVVHEEWDYTAGLVLLAMERVAERTRDARFVEYVRRNMDRAVQPDGMIRTYELEEFNLDQINQGRLLFPLYERTRDERYRKALDLLREQLRRQPRTKEGGFWHKNIYPHQMWLDGLYMAGPFYAQYGRAFGEAAAFDDVARQFLLVARHTRDPETGLMYHGWDESRSQVWADKETGRSPHFWGRAVGWYLMAIADVLDFLPDAHKDRGAILRIFTDLADAVARVQDPVTGLWYQILDQPSRAGNYLESSASSMFIYAFAKGASRGWLDARYRAVAERGFDGLIEHMVSVDATGLVSLNRIVQVGGLGGKQQRDGSFRYYISEPVVSNDHKGVGAFILAAIALDR